MKFVGRESELSFLEEQYNRDSSMVIIYGRRRIGKTTLIKEFIKNKKAIYFLATEESINENRKDFQNTIFQITKNNFYSENNEINWENLFNFVNGEKWILVIDEYQYLTMTDKSFTSKIQKIWDEFLKNKNVMLVLSGSLTNMMYSETLDSSSPLYGRRTGQIKLQELSFDDYKQFFDNKKISEIIDFYSVTGGVPKYVESFDLRKSLLQNIKDNIINVNSYLYEEPIFLLSKEVKEIGSFFSIIKSISFGNHKLSKISADIGIKQSSLIYYINVLQDLDIIERQVPITEKNPQKSKRGLYFIKDKFINFWFNFVYPYRNFIEMNNKTFVLEKIENNLIDNHVSFVYEDICKKKVLDLSANNFFNKNIIKVGRFWNNNFELDILGVDIKQNPVLFGECKYQKNKVGKEVLNKLKFKAEKISSKEKVYVIFSKSGFRKDLLDLSEKENNIFLFDNKIL